MTEVKKTKVGRPMGKLHQDDIRKKIQVSLLIKKLEDHALSDSEEEMPSSKLKAIQILLNKSLPDLSSMQISGDSENPLEVDVHVNVFGELLKSMKMQRQSEA